jgi:type III restriction enzyme
VAALARRKDDADPPDVEAFMDARADVAALGLVEEVWRFFDAEADKLAKKWLDEYRVAVKDLPHERQDAYRQVREMSAEPQDVDLMKPEGRMENTAISEAGSEKPIETFRKHLLIDEAGAFPAELNSWERKVVDVETA